MEIVVSIDVEDECKVIFISFPLFPISKEIVPIEALPLRGLDVAAHQNELLFSQVLCEADHVGIVPSFGRRVGSLQEFDLSFPKGLHLGRTNGFNPFKKGIVGLGLGANSHQNP